MEIIKTYKEQKKKSTVVYFIYKMKGFEKMCFQVYEVRYKTRCGKKKN